MPLIYLDANASEPLRPEARAAALAAMAVAGNPAAIHQAGRTARRLLEDAREAIATHLQADDVIFTSGATEANALAIQALGAGRPVLVGATEHDAVRAAAPGAVVVPVTAAGTVAPAVLAGVLAAHPGALLCLMAANNETGVLHDLAAAAALCVAHGAVLHVDAAQAVGRVTQDWWHPGIVSLAISGHKCGGPLGAGALLLAPGQVVTPSLRGGGQESNRRGGTPALPAIAGMAAALTAPYNADSINQYRIDIEEFLVQSGAVVAGADTARLPNTICAAYPALRAETQLIALDMAGIAVSAGAACSSGKLGPSHVLAAMGFGPLATQAIRISLPWNMAGESVAAFKHAYTAMLYHGLRGGRLASTEATLVA